MQLAEGDERPAQALLVHGIRRVSREQILGDDACLGRPAGRQVRVGEPRLGVRRFLLQPGIDADVHEPEQRGQMVGKRVGKAPICGNGAECVAARELSVRRRLNVHERQFRVGDTKPLFDQGLRAVRLAREQAGEEPAGGRQVTGPGAQFSGGGKQVAVVHLAGPVQVSTRGGQIAAVRTRTRKAGEQRQVVWRDTAGVGEHRHLAFGIPVRGARVGQRDQLRGGRGMRSSPDEVAPLDERARQARLERTIHGSGSRGVLEHPDCFVTPSGRKQRVGQVAQLARVLAAGASRHRTARGSQPRVEIGGIEAADPHQDLARPGGIASLLPMLGERRQPLPRLAYRALRRGDRRGLQQRVLVVWLDLQDLPVERPSRLQQPVLQQVIGDAHVLFNGFVGPMGAVVAVAERVGRRPVVREIRKHTFGTRR